MQITNELIQRLAALSKLEFSETEVDAFRADFQNIVSFVEQLQTVDTTGVEPLHYVYEPEANVLRADNVIESISSEEALLNAPLRDTNYFKVPTVIK